MARNDVVRVLIAHEHGFFRDAMRIALEGASGLTVVASAGDGREALAAATRIRPDVAIIDAALPGLDGIRASCLITERVPDCRVLVLADDQDLSVLADGLGCGATGYLTKGAPVTQVVDAVRALHRGETLIPPDMLGPLLSQLLDRRHEHDDALLKLAQLSRREREVLALVAKGSRTSEIADELTISPDTARTHVRRILAKLEMHSRLEAAAYVIDSGLLAHLTPSTRKTRSAAHTPVPQER